MLLTNEFEAYANEHNITADGRTYITNVRTTEPSRMVGTHAKRNVVSWIPSKKMGGLTISTESRSAERYFLMLCEFDYRILEFWDQTEPVKIARTDKRGKPIKGSHTADFLVLSVDGPVLVEVKPETDIPRLMAIYPNDWKEINGEYIFEPAVKALAQYGLQHKVFVYKNSMRYKALNLEMILRSRLATYASDVDVTTAVADAFAECFFWSLSELRDHLELQNYVPLLNLIDEGFLFFDVDNVLLSEPQSVVLVRNKSLLMEAKQFSASKKITLESGQSPTTEFFQFPPQKYAEEALKRLSRIDSGEKSRSVRRWKEQIREGAKQGLSRFQSLISKKYCSGDHESKLQTPVLNCLTAYLNDKHGKIKGQSKYRSYVRYIVYAKENLPFFEPVSWRTFWRHLDKISASTIAFKQGGKRAANAVEEPSDPETRLLKSDVPWKIASVDHCLAKIFLIFFSDDGVAYVIRPWVTAMVDTYSGSVLAFSISFSAPSRKSVAKVLRECVRQHGMLPTEIMVDRGPDFRSVYFASLLAHYEVIYSMRPAAHPRYGSEVEGLFGDFKRVWLSQRPGNLTNYKEARSVDGKMAPQNFAVLKPLDFYREFKEFCSWREHKPRGIYSESAADRFSNRQTDFPIFGIPVEYDQNLLIATAVETSDYEIDFSRGIKVGEQYYWSPQLGDLRGKKSKTEVRPDPENPHVIYARVDSKWVVCSSSHATRFSSLNSSSQFVESLIVSEGQSARKQISQQADVELVRKIQEMDAIASSGKSAVLELEIDADENLESSIFEKIKNSKIKTLSSGEW